MNRLPTWSVPIYQFDAWAEHDQYQDQLLSLAYQLQHENNRSGVAPHAKRLYESDFTFFSREEPAVVALREYCREQVFQAANDANRGRWEPGARIGIDLHESWVHITTTGGYHDMHSHPNSAWSGIYYIRAGESDLQARNGTNRFYCPWQSAYSDIGTQWSSQVSSIDIMPQDGGMVIFPSWLMHSALPYTGDTERVVMAFNCKFIDGR